MFDPTKLKYWSKFYDKKEALPSCNRWGEGGEAGRVFAKKPVITMIDGKFASLEALARGFSYFVKVCRALFYILYCITN